MSIDFSALPTENPFSTPKPGLYLGKIVKAESQQPKDTSKPEYLAVTMELTDADGNSSGKLFDNFFESDSDVVKFKLGRFVKALKLPLTGPMTFKDFAKILPGRTIVVDVKNEPDDYRGNGAQKAVVDLFAREAYYPVEDFAALTGKEAPETAPQDPVAATTPPASGNY